MKYWILPYMLVLVSCLGACTSAANSLTGTGVLSANALDTLLASYKQTCREDLLKTSAAAEAETVCTCLASEVNAEAKKDPQITEDKLANLIPAAHNSCAAQRSATQIAPSPSPAS